MPENKPPAPNNIIAVVGCGYWGKNLVRNFAQLGSLAMVCDPDPVARQRALDITNDVEAVASFEKVIDSDVTGVVISTPATTHYSLARRALKAGKDIFVEKPLALTYKEGNDLVRVAKDAGRILMVGHLLEYHPAITCLLDLVRADELGSVYYIHSTRLSLGKVRREENILWSFAPHDIAVILRLMDSMPVQVVTCGGNYVQPQVTDVTVTNLLFENGSRAHVYVSWLHPFKEQRLVVVGSKKMASFDDVAKKLVLYDQHVEIKKGEPVPVRGDGIEVDFPQTEPLRQECEAFLRAMETRTPPITDGPSGVRVLEVLNAAQRSLTSGGEPVSLPYNS